MGMGPHRHYIVEFKGLKEDRRKLLLLSMDRDKLCDPREIPEEQWSNDVSLWPELEFGQIYRY